MNETIIPSGCDVVQRSPVDVPTGEWDWAEDYAFHRHCQQTVCSAYGPDGRGLTWNILVGNPLPNIAKVISPVDWKTYFTKNTDNITQDLRSILELIDAVAGKSFQFNIHFIDANGTALNVAQSGTSSVEPFSPGTEANIDHTFKIGRIVNLSFGFNGIGSFPIRFNTAQEGGGDILSLTVPSKTLTTTYNGVQVATTTNIIMDSNQEIIIEDDCNEISKTSASSPIQVRKFIHAYASTSNDALQSINLGVYDTTAPTENLPIVSFEIHVRNDGGMRKNLSRPSFTNVSTYPSIIALTDKLYVDPGYTNAYVFRWDRFRSKMTYSLAYQYPN